VKEGLVYGCGKNTNSELALEQLEVLEFTEIPTPPDIVAIASSDFTVALTEDGEIVVWGPTPRGTISKPFNLTRNTKLL